MWAPRVGVARPRWPVVASSVGRNPVVLYLQAGQGAATHRTFPYSHRSWITSKFISETNRSSHTCGRAHCPDCAMRRARGNVTRTRTCKQPRTAEPQAARHVTGRDIRTRGLNRKQGLVTHSNGLCVRDSPGGDRSMAAGRSFPMYGERASA